MVLGCYYLTRIKEVDEKDMLVFASIDDTTVAFDNEAISYHTQIKVRVNNELKTTTYGRLLFNEIVPEGLGFINETVGK
jgi:DNA-directed RNA polymerase subunit beta'